MPVTFREASLDYKHELAAWLASDVWDNFSNPKCSYDVAIGWIERGIFHAKDKRTFWVIRERHEKVGLIQLHDLSDSTAMFDLRVNTKYRGMGIGSQAVVFLTSYAFTTFRNLARIEATTRADNVAMRKILLACGYEKEAHYRAGWRYSENPEEWIDAVAYATLRHDWMNQVTSPVNWEDEWLSKRHSDARLE